MFIKEECINKIIIDKSEFIGYIKRCNTIDEFNEYLVSIKKKHYDATHHCSAYIGNNIKRSNDDGEPSGSAGLPILSSLEKNNLENVGAIVVRYFGGIKLGMGGLIRAYSKSISETLKLATFTQNILMKEYILQVSYDIANKVDYFLRNNTNIVDVNYDINVIYRFYTKDDLSNKISEYTKGILPVFIKDVIVEEEVK